MKRAKKIFSLFLAAALLLVSVFQMPAGAGAKEYAKKTKYYTVSKKAGTYTSAIKVKIKAKKGYQVYYKVSGKFKTSRVVKSGKSKVLNIKKTTVLSLCAVKNKKKVTNKKLNKVFKKKKTAYYAEYKYTILESAETEASPDADNSAAENAATVPEYSDGSGSITPKTSEAPPSEGMPSGSQNPFLPGTNDDSAGTADGGTEVKSAAQEKLNAVQETLTAAGSTQTVTVPSVEIGADTPQVALTDDGITKTNVADGAVAYESVQDSDLKTLTIKKAGTYVISGGTASKPVTNTEIIVANKITDAVNLIWDNLVIDNNALGNSEDEDVPVFYVSKKTTEVHVFLKGASAFTGNGTFSKKPAAAVICAEDGDAVLTFSVYGEDTEASLTVTDAMPSSTDFGTKDPSDGIYSKGTLAFGSGTYSITVNGDCLKGTGSDGGGGIIINDGSYTLYSSLGNGLKSKKGSITINGGTLKSEYTAGDGIQAKNYNVTITGGTIEIDKCYGDGIQGENINISGESTDIDIKTYFENAGVNYYNTALTNHNTLTSTETSKKEVVNVDTGSHKGLKGGTKAHTYSYKTVDEDSEYEAGTTYTTEASGGIVISGGNIKIDTTNTGIKYNGSSGGNRPGSGGSNSGSLSAATSDGQYIIGAPDDGIHSNNTCVIAGGTLEIYSSDDGITGPAGIVIMNGCDIAINQCYEGIEGGEIIIGSSEGADASPAVKIYSDDDGVNAASKSAVNYVYENETEEKYTKTETASKGNRLIMLDGYLNVMIGDNETHSFSLAVEGGAATTGSYTSDGDAIDCNGSFYAYGGTIVVFGPNSDGNSPIDTDDGYYIGSGVTLLAVGKSQMAESPTGKGQPVVVYGNSGSSFSMGPGQGKTQSGNSSLSANTVFAIMNGDDMLLAVKPVKSYNYVLYSSPDLVSGTEYTMYSGGSVSGSLLWPDESAYDYRYTGYNASGATKLGSVKADG